MSRFIHILPFSFLAFCLAQDSNLYVNRIKIETFHNNQGNDKTFTYYVADSFDQSQKDNYKTDAGSIGSLYEDDYAADTATCSAMECPKLRRIYAYLNTTSGKTTTRIIDSAMKSSNTGASGAKPIGLVAPYPGYCSSDDSMPIIEMYSDELKQFAYWSPAQPDQLVNIASTTLDKSRYYPIRLVGYALSSTDRLVMQNTAPDYVKPLGKANYTHSFFPTFQIIQFSNSDNIANLAQYTTIDKFDKSQYPTTKSTGVFVLAKVPTVQNLQLEAVCGERISIYAAWDANRKFILFFPRDVKSPFIAHSLVGYTLKTNKSTCGGIKGLAKLREFSNASKPGFFAYENDATKIQQLISEGYTETSKDLGFAPLDKIGFLLINAVM